MALFLMLSSLGGCGKSSKKITNIDGDGVSDFGDDINFGDGGDGTDGNGNGTGGGGGSSGPGRFGVKNTKTMPNFIKDLPAVSTITFMMSDNIDTKYEQEQIAAFKELTGKEIKFKYERATSWNAMPDELAAMVYANNAPDMFRISNVVGAWLVKKPIFEDLNTYIDIDDPLWRETKGFLSDKYTTIDNKRYAAMISKEGAISVSSGMIYNKKLTNAAIAKSGGTLKDPVTMFYEGTWNWDAFKKFVTLITVPGNPTPQVWGLSGNATRLYGFISSTGTDIVSYKNGKFESTIDSASVLRAYSYARELSEISPDSVSWDYVTRFTQDKIGFYFGSPYAEFAIPELLPLKKAGTIQFVPMPKDPEADAYYLSGEGNYNFIPKGAKNAKAAAAWYYYLRYLEYNQNPNLIAQEKASAAETFGWTANDYQYYKKDIAAMVKPLPLIGPRVEGFDINKFTSGVANAQLGTPAQILAELKPGHVAAINRHNNLK